MQSFRTISGAAISICALFSGSAPSLAQASNPNETNVITVIAPRAAPAPVERNPYTGAAITVTTVKIPVRYGDLNLANPRDAERLSTRIRSVARAACRQLDRTMPLNQDSGCVNKAVARAKPQVSAAIAAAKSALKSDRAGPAGAGPGKTQR